MAMIPDFLLKKVYKKGSLKETTDGICFDLKNIFGTGAITGVNFIKINDMLYESPVIKILTSGTQMLAETINNENPALFRMNQEATCILEGAKGLKEGLNNIIVEIISKEVGKIQVKLSDTL